MGHRGDNCPLTPELFFSHNVKMNSYDDLEDAERQDSNEQIDRSTLFQFKTPENSNELRYF